MEKLLKARLTQHFQKCIRRNEGSDMGYCWSLRPVNMLRLLLLHWIMLLLYIGATRSQPVVRGVVGRAITLPCKYSVQSRDHLTHMCWGQGNCPNSKCSNEILRTNGMRVTSRKSHRYQLNGRITRGDVSLTILNANKEDNGVYCCRIEVRGWFNDIKKNLVLQVDAATTTASTTTITTTPHRIITTSTTTPLTTPVTLPTTTPFLSTIKSTSPTVPVVVSENTNVPTMVTTGSQYESTDDGSWILVTETRPTTTVTTTASLTITTTTPHRITTINSTAFLATAVTPSIPPPFLRTTNSVSPTISNVDPTTTNVSAMTTSSVSTATAFLTTAPSLVYIKPSPSSLQEKWAENGCCFLITETTSSITGTANAQKFKGQVNVIHYAIASSTLLLVLLALVIAVKCKQMRKYHLPKMNSLNGQKESEETLAGAEGESGLFIL